LAEAQKLDVRPRQVVGKKVAQLRREGVLPGVVFGGHKDSASVQTDLRAFERSYRRWGNTTLLSLEGLDGDAIPALIHGVARDTLTGRLLHVDFQRVSLTEKTHAEVPLHFVHESPAVKTLGAVLVHARDHVSVEAFPQDMPHAIEVDLSPLAEIDDALYVRDLVVDKTLVRLLDDDDELVVKAVPVGSGPVLTAMHWKKGGILFPPPSMLKANWVISQRLPIGSYSTTGSPRSSARQIIPFSKSRGETNSRSSVSHSAWENVSRVSLSRTSSSA